MPDTDPTTPEPADAQDTPEARTDDGGRQDRPERDPWADPGAARREIEKLRREAASWRTKYREAEPLVEASKTDVQRLDERASTAERERDELRAQVARHTLAAEHGVPGEYAHLITGTSDEEMRQAAQTLAQLAANESTPPAPARVRPVESLRPGAAPAADGDTPADDNAWLRGRMNAARGR